MRCRRTKEFKKLFAKLPAETQKEARASYILFSKNPYHPSLQFKCIDKQDPIYSARVGLHYRAVGWYEDGLIRWFWIGSHADYDHL